MDYGANAFAQSDIVFDATSTVVTCSDNSVRIKDGLGMEVIVSYSSIKHLALSARDLRTLFKHHYSGGIIFSAQSKSEPTPSVRSICF
jgi:hypothetical protein